jgi:D,D-heptose 1,7-bisphosphate phosphatase
MPSRTKAIFLDRDGTINREVGNLHRIEDLRLLPGAARAIRAMNRMGFLVVIVTNQSVVAYGLLKEKQVDEIHALLIQRLQSRGAKIDAVYYCPHHPTKAVVKEYGVFCRCRKPEIGMILKAIKKMRIDRSKSFLIGDMTTDIETGKRAKLTTILVKTGHAGTDGRYGAIADFTARNLSQAVAIIKKTCQKK